MAHFVRSFVVILFITSNLWAQNPLITDQFTADPSARVFEDQIYIYPSHDIIPPKGEGRTGWFNMADYHVFSSADLSHWTDHGVIVSQDKVDWVNPKAYSMWAPDCVFKNGKYYFYFPTIPKDTTKYGKGFAIGVAVADKPYGPFVPQIEPIKNVHGIDPNILIDKDGQAYLYWAQGDLFVAKLKDNMQELASAPSAISNLPDKGLKEGPFVFERNGIYYLTYPHVENKTERLEYAMSDNPMGPFKVAGVIMDESPTGCWTNHQSIVKYKGQWYLFYHHNDLSPDFDKSRSIRADSLFFNKDGTIQKVTPTLRGVGATQASQKIEIDRYSSKSQKGVLVSFLDTLNVFKGWKTIFGDKDAWIKYNSVHFGEKIKTVHVRAISETGGTLQIRLDKIDGPLLAEMKISKTAEWKIVDAPILAYPSGSHDLVVVSKDSPVEIDWIQFTD